MAISVRSPNQAVVLSPCLNHFEKHATRYAVISCLIVSLVGTIVGVATSSAERRVQNAIIGFACGYGYGFAIIVIFSCVLERQVQREREGASQPLLRRDGVGLI